LNDGKRWQNVLNASDSSIARKKLERYLRRSLHK